MAARDQVPVDSEPPALQFERGRRSVAVSAPPAHPQPPPQSPPWWIGPRADSVATGADDVDGVVGDRIGGRVAGA